VRSCEVLKTLNVDPLLPIERSQQIRSTLCPNVPGKTGETSPAGYTHGKAAQRLDKEQGGVTTSPTLLESLARGKTCLKIDE